MIDIHSHLLPEVDDGSKGMRISVQLARDAVADGITHALMTPHHMNREFMNHPDDVIARTAAYQDMLKECGIPLTVFPAQEVHVTGDLLGAIDSGDILTCDDGGRYVLLEFPHNDVPSYSRDLFFQVMQRGMTPIIVHPERNTYFMKHTDQLYDFIQSGCLSQITASSYVGTFGKGVQQFAADIITAGLGHVLASDAHYLPGREYEMSAAFKKLAREFGQERADAFEANAKAIVNGEPVERFTELPIKKRLFSKY